MVFPIADDNTGRRLTPYVNYTLIAINVVVFVLFQHLGQNLKFTYAFAVVPKEIVTGKDLTTPGKVLRDRQTGSVYEIPGLQPTPIPVYLTLLTSMFMHANLMHLFGNMLFLWIFGDNVEDSLGHLRYSIFYLVCGLLASIAHIASTYAFDGNPLIPTLGASGAISGVLGGYLVLHPRRRVLVVLFRLITEVPALVAIGMWFLFQLIYGLGALGTKTGGVAYGAHIGGFLAGLLLVKVFAIGAQREERTLPQGRWVNQ
ncbi:MAG: rhomboid family intramembrane serine protease [Gemmatales bacterium]|nr:MAG: rhomboid family intramembrane serine protease [Gemmatales bacterium]